MTLHLIHTNWASKCVFWFDPWWEQAFAYFALLHFFGVGIRLYTAASIFLQHLSRGDLHSPSQIFTVTSTAATTCSLHPPGTGCSALQSPCCQQTQTHFTEKHVSQDLCCFQWLWEKMPILNKQNYIPQHQHPSASPPQRTPVLSVFGNLSGSPVLRHWQCIAPYLPLSFKHRRHLQVTGKTKIFI